MLKYYIVLIVLLARCLKQYFVFVPARVVAERARGKGGAEQGGVTHQGGATLCSSAKKSERQRAGIWPQRFACMTTLPMAIWIDTAPSEMWVHLICETFGTVSLEALCWLHNQRNDHKVSCVVCMLCSAQGGELEISYICKLFVWLGCDAIL